MVRSRADDARYLDGQSLRSGPEFGIFGSATLTSWVGIKLKTSMSLLSYRPTLRYRQKRPKSKVSQSITIQSVPPPTRIREAEADGQTTLPELGNTSISIIIHSSIGLGILKSLYPADTDGRRTRSATLSSSPRAVWFQPGAESEEIRHYVRDMGLEGKVILGGPCILVEGEELLRARTASASASRL